jgi:hypothetical protein
MLMDMKARVEAMRALAYYTAGQMDRAHGHKDSATRQSAQTLVDLLIPVVKGWCTDSALGITSDGVQDPRRHGLHRGNRRFATPARRAHHDDLRRARPASRPTT